MFTRAKQPTLVESAMERAFEKLGEQSVDSEQYAKTLDGIVKLHKMREEEKSPQVSPDTVLLVGANLLGILLIIRHEHVNVITSRAMGTLIKPR
jgi:preprotein translocase subunit Sec61beta